MNNYEQYIISWCFLSPDDSEHTYDDYWQMEENLQDAKNLYNDVLNREPYIASISAVVQSTNYDIHPKLNELFDE